MKNDYTDDNDHVAQAYHDALKNETLAPLPVELQPYQAQVFQLIDSVYSDANLPKVDNDRGAKTNHLNANFEKKEFKELWNRINRKAVYSVHFDSDELVVRLVELRESLRSEYSVGQTLKEQLAEAVEHEQYERAAQLRDELTRREMN